MARQTPNARELDILAWLAGGATVARIAAELKISVPAAKEAIIVLRKRMGALTAAHLVSLAHIAGYLETPCARPHAVAPTPRCDGRIEALGVDWLCDLLAGHEGDHRNGRLGNRP